MEAPPRRRMTAPDALRRAADTVEACAYGERSDAIITLLARLCERVAMGTWCEDECEALVRLVRAG